MKERPIIFSAPMVRAILEGRKTQTRRIEKPQPASDGVGLPQHAFFGLCAITLESDGSTRWHPCPYGIPGDRIWVRESWYSPAVGNTCLGYVADGDHPHGVAYRKRPSIFMPRAASRLTLEVTGVRAERLQTINARDAQAEGVKPIPCGACVGGECIRQGPYCEHFMAGHIEAYQRLWNDINGAGSWEANPWVWVVEFRRAV